MCFVIGGLQDIKTLLEKKGHTFESETDTEVIAKLIKHVYDQHPTYSFRELVEQVIPQLVCPLLGFFIDYSSYFGQDNVSVPFCLNRIVRNLKRSFSLLFFTELQLVKMPSSIKY